MTENIHIPYYQKLDHHAKLTGELNQYTAQVEHLLQFYQQMVMTRTFDQKAIALQRTGRLGTYASSLGQEAIGTALGYAMAANDVLVPAYREYAAQFIRGVRMADILLYWGGDERGMAYRTAPEGTRQDLPISVPIATQTCHAAGVAYAMKLRKQKRACVCVLGDGASSKGDFYEAMNAAGVWQLPVVFIVINNQWAISLPRSKQTAARTLAQKGIAAGIAGEQVDGNDVMACYERFQQALSVAHDNKGPTLIEAITFRLSDHTTADDANRYRDAADVEKQWQYEPIRRLEALLKQTFNISAQQFESIHHQSTEQVDAEIAVYLDTPPQRPQSIFDHLYAQLPDALATQKKQLLQKVSAKPRRVL